MTAPVAARFRERLKPNPPGNRVKLGTIQTILNIPKGQLQAGDVWDTQDLYSSVSATHPEYERTWDEIHHGPPFKSGGPFIGVKSFLPHFDVKGSGVYESRDFPAGDGYGHIVYTGGWGEPYFTGTDIDINEFINAGLDQTDNVLFPSLEPIAAGAYARLRPQLERAGMGVALAEARDLPRMFKTTAKGFHDVWKSMGGKHHTPFMQPKRLAGDYLNHQFGWVPFLSDLDKFFDVYANSAKYIAQIKRDNNTWIRRARVDKMIESETFLPGPGNNRCEPYIGTKISRIFAQPGSCGILQRNSTQVWYTGSFKYYRPEFDGSLHESSSDDLFKHVHRLSTIYGARVNPSVIYRATPWTWLIDWFSNVGDVVQRANDQAVDSMVSRYMYLMHHLRRESVVQQILYLKDGGKKTLEWSRLAEVKRRVGADGPYGFGLSWGDLTPRQLTILGALGISRMS